MSLEITAFIIFQTLRQPASTEFKIVRQNDQHLDKVTSKCQT